MFSGIVEETGRVARVGSSSGGIQITIECATVLGGTRIGDSISVDGVCLTVSQMTGGTFTANVQPVTARLSTLAGLRTGDAVNLERAVAAGQRLGGHYVQGHVDGTGRITARRGEGAALIVRIELPAEMARYVVERGFIAVDGASLTVMSRSGSTIDVSLVYHTQQHITLSTKRPGDRVNLEADVVARYVESLVAPYGNDAGLSMEKLRNAGFM